MSGFGDGVTRNGLNVSQLRLRIICQVLEMASQECICNCLVRLRIICQVLEMVSQECICNCLL